MGNRNSKLNTPSLNNKCTSTFFLISGVFSHISTIAGMSVDVSDTETAAEIGPFQLFARSANLENLSLETTVKSDTSSLLLKKNKIRLYESARSTWVVYNFVASCQEKWLSWVVIGKWWPYDLALTKVKVFKVFAFLRCFYSIFCDHTI